MQQSIQVHMVNMIKSIGMKSTDLNKLLVEFPPGGESLVVKILTIICESRKSSVFFFTRGLIVFNSCISYLFFL